MQPYLFPYLGYFQLINAVDDFVFYDDVAFIKQGWITRNKILHNEEAKLITLPCKGVSSNKQIKDTYPENSKRNIRKLIGTVNQAYSKAPYFKEVFPLVEKVFDDLNDNIARIAGNSIVKVSEYLNLNVNFYYSSTLCPESKKQNRSNRLITITKKLESTCYINSQGGKQLYSKDYFCRNGVDLKILNPHLSEYKQFNNSFIPGLSVIDVMMFNSREKMQEMLNAYGLE